MTSARPRQHAHRLAAAIGAIVIALPAPAGASDIDDSRDIGTLLGMLDAPDLATREEAATRLERRTDLTLADLERFILESPDASPERTSRLLGLARERFRRGPRAGMGIQFGGRTPGGVTIGATVAGFDAARVLRARDEVVAIGGRPAESAEWMRYEILSLEPGETMDLTIDRAGREMDVTVVMGSFDDLNRGRRNLIDEQTLRAAWRVRAARTGVTGILDAERVRTGIGGSAPPLTGLFGDGDDQPPPPLIRWLVEGQETIIGGGRARGGADRFDRPRTRIGGVDASLPIAEPTTSALESGDEQQRFALHLDGLQSAKRSIDNEASSIKRQLARSTLTPEQRRSMEAEAARLADASRILSERIRAWFDLADHGALDG